MGNADSSLKMKTQKRNRSNSSVTPSTGSTPPMAIPRAVASHPTVATSFDARQEFPENSPKSRSKSFFKRGLSSSRKHRRSTSSASQDGYSSLEDSPVPSPRDDVSYPLVQPLVTHPNHVVLDIARLVSTIETATRSSNDLRATLEESQILMKELIGKKKQTSRKPLPSEAPTPQNTPQVESSFLCCCGCYPSDSDDRL